MTPDQLRDWFAGLAMQAMLSDPALSDIDVPHGSSFAAQIAHMAYTQAEAMMRQRG